jgi:hypothetical protein
MAQASQVKDNSENAAGNPSRGGGGRLALLVRK